MRSCLTPFDSDVPAALARLFVVYAAVAIVLIAVLMPPFQAADELNHAERAEQIAHGGLLAVRSADGMEAGGKVASGLAQLAAPFDPVRFHPQVKVAASMREAESVLWGARETKPFPNTAIYPPVFYLPAAFGLLSGQILHATVWHSVVIARIVTGLVSACLAAIAIALAEGFAPFLFTLFCLPMSLALFSAISQDGPMIASAGLGSVLLARESKRGFWNGCGLIALVTMARPAYLPLCLVPLLVPDRSWPARLSAAGLIAALTMAWATLVGDAVMPRSASLHIAEQLAAIRTHPNILLALSWTTFRREILDGLPIGREFIGVLGWLDTTFPNPYYALTGSLLLATTWIATSRRLHARHLVGMLVVMSAAAAVYAVQYLSWSSIGGWTIDGVQGRYFLPLAPFLLFALSPSRQPYPGGILWALHCYPAFSIALTVRAILIRYGLT